MASGSEPVTCCMPHAAIARCGKPRDAECCVILAALALSLSCCMGAKNSYMEMYFSFYIRSLCVSSKKVVYFPCTQVWLLSILQPSYLLSVLGEQTQERSVNIVLCRFTDLAGRPDWETINPWPVWWFIHQHANVPRAAQMTRTYMSRHTNILYVSNPC